MALARVVSFEGVSADRMEEMKREMADQERPEGLPATELVVLHDPETEKLTRDRVFRHRGRLPSRATRRVDAMPAAETPGMRTSVAKYNVAVRMKG